VLFFQTIGSIFIELYLTIERTAGALALILVEAAVLLMMELRKDWLPFSG
jgi:hypothetical protein